MKCPVCVLLAVVVLAACGCNDEPPVATAEDEIVLALNWYPEAEHGGFYAALVHGYYEEAGLKVTIRPGGPAAPVISEVATGKALFGVSNADQILIQRGQGADVVALMAPIQNSPRCIMVHEDSGIRDFAGLKNVTLAMSAGRPFAQFLRRAASLENVQVVPYNGGVTEFLSGKNRAQQGYLFSEPFTAREKGAKPHCLLISDLGFNPYTSVLFTHEKTTAASPEMVRKFIAASVRGWETYLQSPEKTNEYIHSINPEMPLDALAYGVDSLRPLCEMSLEDAQFGSMLGARWDRLLGQLIEIDAVRADEAERASFILSDLAQPVMAPASTE